MAALQAAMGAMQDVDLPPLWHAIANAPKHLLLAEAQATFSATAQQLGMSTYPPVITVTLSCTLETLSFCANSPRMLTKGFQPFNLVLVRFSSQALKAAAAAANYNHISARGTLVSMPTFWQYKVDKTLCYPAQPWGLASISALPTFPW